MLHGSTSVVMIFKIRKSGLRFYPFPRGGHSASKIGDSEVFFDISTFLKDGPSPLCKLACKSYGKYPSCGMRALRKSLRFGFPRKSL